MVLAEEYIKPRQVKIALVSSLVVLLLAMLKVTDSIPLLNQIHLVVDSPMNWVVGGLLGLLAYYAYYDYLR